MLEEKQSHTSGQIEAANHLGSIARRKISKEELEYGE